MAAIKQEEVDDSWDAFIHNFENGPDMHILGENITFDNTESLIPAPELESAVDPAAYKDTSKLDDVNMLLDFANQMLEPPAKGMPNIDLSQQTGETSMENGPYYTDQLDFTQQTCEVPAGHVPDFAGGSFERTEGVSNNELGAKLDAIKALHEKNSRYIQSSTDWPKLTVNEREINDLWLYHCKLDTFLDGMTSAFKIVTKHISPGVEIKTPTTPVLMQHGKRFDRGRGRASSAQTKW